MNDEWKTRRETMNDEVQTRRIYFIVHRSYFIVSPSRRHRAATRDIGRDLRRRRAVLFAIIEPERREPHLRSWRGAGKDNVDLVHLRRESLEIPLHLVGRGRRAGEA